MKRFRFLLAMLALVLAFGLAFVSCDNDTTGGGNTPGGNAPSGGASTFTITGIPSQYNGKYAVVQGESASGVGFSGVQSFPISGGSASVPLYVYTTGFAYTGTEVAHVAFGIYNQLPTPGSNEGYISGIRILNIPFTNGSATKSWADGTAQ
ncbi:MAG: hypothetical protein LBQ94_09050 [Treponema sp.]|jgi:hypothetical protein|nr:hypothetical protein [Treponema sp.]